MAEGRMAHSHAVTPVSANGFGVSGAVLKWVAVITMLIDHFGAAVFVLNTSYFRADNTEAFRHADAIYRVLRTIGRTAFPIFCFLLVEGFFHTRQRFYYIIRMFFFCILSEIPFDLAIYDKWYDFTSQNVYWTLLLGLLAMTVIEWSKEKFRYMRENGRTSFWTEDNVEGIVHVLIAFAFMTIAYLMQTDYDMNGVALILILYLFDSTKFVRLLVGYLSMLWEAWCFPGFILMYFYNGKRGRQPKYFFYLFYPCHLLLLYFLRVYLRKG
jgi:hypothetical protein